MITIRTKAQLKNYLQKEHKRYYFPESVKFEINIDVQFSIRSDGDIISIGDICSGGNIRSDGDIISIGDICSGGNIRSDGDIRSGGYIWSDGYIRSRRKVMLKNLQKELGMREEKNNDK